MEKQEYDKVFDWLYEVEGHGDESPLTPFTQSIGINSNEPITEFVYEAGEANSSEYLHREAVTDNGLCVIIILEKDADNLFDFYRDGKHIAAYKPSDSPIKGTKYEGGQWDTTKKSA
jgi:hypothetical protein